MCFFYGINKSVKQIEKAFNAKFDNSDFEPIQEVNGFAHPFMPIIVDKRPDIISESLRKKNTVSEKKIKNETITPLF